MPWYGFTKYGIQDIPDLVSSVTTGQIFLYASAGRKKALPALGYETGTPEGYLRCDGQTAVIADNQGLYDFFVNELGSGTYFGVAPAGEFRLPNFSGRLPIGLDTTKPAVNAIGNTGGAPSHSHIITASHTHATVGHVHTLSNHRHSYGNHVHSIPGHTHPDGGLSGDNTGAGANPLYADTSAPYDFYVTKVSHSHTASGTSGGVSSGFSSENPSRNLTEQVTGPLPSTSSTSDLTQGSPSASTSLSATGTDSIPPYYSTYYIIKV